jgi:hypothetical protein
VKLFLSYHRLGPNDALDEVDEARYVRIHAIRACKSAELSERRDSDNVVHAVGLSHHDLCTGVAVRTHAEKKRSLRIKEHEILFNFFRDARWHEKKRNANSSRLFVPFVFNERV